MRATAAFILFLSTAAICHAHAIIWHNGVVVLSDRVVMVGEIARVDFDLLLYRSENGAITSFPAHKVSSFRYYDKAGNINRTFISIPRRAGARKTYKYYESVVLGKISVFRIQQVFDQAIDETNPESFRFYVEQGHIVRPLRLFRKKFFEQISKELGAREVSFKSLDPNTKYGALSLIILYNQTATGSSVASLNQAR